MLRLHVIISRMILENTVDDLKRLCPILGLGLAADLTLPCRSVDLGLPREGRRTERRKQQGTHACNAEQGAGGPRIHS